MAGRGIATDAGESRRLFTGLPARRHYVQIIMDKQPAGKPGREQGSSPDAELRELDAAVKRGGLLVVFGRRRVGKTRRLRQWLQARDGLYSQAIEAQRGLQIQQVFAGLRPQLETQLVPKTWPELLETLALQKRRWVLCLDEFPYLTAVDASLPSQLQKWLDHSLPAAACGSGGSGTRMMNDLFHRSAPLTAAQKLLHVSRWITRRSARLRPAGRSSRSRNSPPSAFKY